MSAGPPDSCPPPCPDPERLRAFRDGSLSDDDRRAVAHHLESCRPCRVAVWGEASPSTPTGLHVGTLGPGTATDPNARPSFPSRLGAYEVQEVIGQGGMGVVCRAWHGRLKRLAAVKFLRPDRISASRLARFLREMEAVGRFDHPNIVRALDADEAGGYHYLVMEYLSGASLAQVIADGPVPVEAACELVRQAAVGMQFAHEQGLVHRDLKPSNLFLTPDGTVKVLDFGLALLREEVVPDERLTSSGEVMGTADFMAPEQGAGGTEVDIRADIYSLGCTLFALLTGQPPYAGPNHRSMYQKVQAHNHASVPSARDRRPDVPAALDAVLVRMLAKSPGNRFATPAQVADALAPFSRREGLADLLRNSRGGTDSISSAVTIKAPAPPPRRRWVMTAVAGLAVVAAVALLVWSANRGGESGGPGPNPPRLPRPGEWQELLTTPPDVLQAPPKRKHWHLSPEERELRVDTGGTCLFKLGQTDADDYEIEVEVQQTHWIGGFGVFFGYRRLPGGDGKGYRYQSIELESDGAPPVRREFRLQRALSWKDPPHERIHNFSSESVPAPGVDGCLLRLAVAGGQLRQVSWEGKPLPLLLQANAPPPLDAADGKGAFGLTVHNCTCVFRRARFLYR